MIKELFGTFAWMILGFIMCAYIIGGTSYVLKKLEWKCTKSRFVTKAIPRTETCIEYQHLGASK